MEELGLENKSQNIFNCDETGFICNIGTKKVYCKRGIKRVNKLCANNDKDMFTVHVCANADGLYLPPYVVYKAKTLFDSWCLNGPKNCHYNRSNSGWMEEDQFVEWFKAVFIKYTTKIQGAKILILDGHSSHLSSSVIALARTNNIHIICMPSHSSHVLQPLDVGVFKQVKAEWKKVLEDYFIKHNFQNVNKEHFPSMLKKVCENSFRRQYIVTGFEETGIWPFNREAIDESKIILNDDEDEDEDLEEDEEVENEMQASKSTQKKSKTRTNNKTATVEPTTSSATSDEPTTSKKGSKKGDGPGRKSNKQNTLVKAISTSVNLIIKSNNKIQPRKAKKRVRRDQAECITEEDVLAQTNEKKEPKKRGRKRKADIDDEEETESFEPKSSNEEEIESFESETSLDNCYLCSKPIKNDKWVCCEASSCQNRICSVCINKKKIDSTQEYFCLNCTKISPDNNNNQKCKKLKK